MKIVSTFIQPLKDIIDKKYIEHTNSYYDLDMLNKLDDFLKYDVKTIYLIYRKIYKVKFKLGIFSHSGLLIEIKNEQDYKYFILEYGSGSNNQKDVIHLIPVLIKNIKDNKIYDNDIIWNIKNKTEIKDKITLLEVYNIMKNNMIKYKYNLYNWNCHIAQEKTREALGEKLNNYNKYKYSLLIHFIIFLLCIIILLYLFSKGIKIIINKCA
jgi:hypothetical protein